MEADKLKDTLVDENTKVLANVQDETLAVVKKKTLCDTMGDVEAEALVKMLYDEQAEVEAKRLGNIQLVEILANMLEGIDTKTLFAH